MNESINEPENQIEWPPPGWEIIKNELHQSGSGNGYDEAIKIPAAKIEEFRAMLQAGFSMKEAIAQCAVIAFVWYDWDSPFYGKSDDD